MDAILKLAYPAQTEEQKEKYSCFFELESIAPGFEPEITYDNDGFRIMLTYYDCELLGQYVDGELVIEASTSIGGPGYHACLVDIFDGLGVKPIRVEDPTGYYEHRDFAKLQDAMDEWLKDVSASVLQLHRNGGKNIGVSYNPHTTPEESDHFAFCPLGYFEKEFFERAANGERLGKDFFVWWNKEPDALYCCQVAMNLIWWQVIWIKPVSETEEEVLSSVLTCLEKAYEMDSADKGQKSLEYPVAEWLEIARLAGDAETERLLGERFGEIGKGTLGYMRGNIVSGIDDWTFLHRGSMYISEGDNGELIWKDDDFEITVLSSHINLRPGMAFKPGSLLHKVIGGDKSYKMHVNDNALMISYAVKTSRETEPSPHFSMQVYALRLNDVLSLKLVFTDPDKTDLANLYVNSVRHRAVHKP